MVAKCYGGAVNGVESRTVEIEVFSREGTSSFAIVGLPDQAVREAKVFQITLKTLPKTNIGVSNKVSNSSSLPRFYRGLRGTV